MGPIAAHPFESSPLEAYRQSSPNSQVGESGEATGQNKAAGDLLRRQLTKIENIAQQMVPSVH